MVVGGFVVIKAYAEITAGLAAAPETFSLSAVLVLMHGPVEFAVGGIDIRRRMLPWLYRFKNNVGFWCSYNGV